MHVHKVIFGMAGCADRLTMSELRDVAAMGHAAGMEIILEPGVTAKTDVGRHISTDQGPISGLRPRGMERLRWAQRRIFSRYRGRVARFFDSR